MMIEWGWVEIRQLSAAGGSTARELWIDDRAASGTYLTALSSALSPSNTDMHTLTHTHTHVLTHAQTYTWPPHSLHGNRLQPFIWEPVLSCCFMTEQLTCSWMFVCLQSDVIWSSERATELMTLCESVQVSPLPGSFSYQSLFSLNHHYLYRELQSNLSLLASLSGCHTVATMTSSRSILVMCDQTGKEQK